MTTKLFERLVTKFSIKVNDLAKYLEISKATIYNYRNLEKFSDIPSDKQYKILYLFGKETEEELELVLDESDNDILAKYVTRISNILKDSASEKQKTLQSSVEELKAEVENLTRENADLKRQQAILQKFDSIDEFSKSVVLDKVAKIINGSSTAEIKEFIDYLTIFETYRNLNKRDV